MNFAVSLIMTCVFFRLFDIPVGNIDIVPDMVGFLLCLIAVRRLRYGEDDFRQAYIPGIFALVLSLFTFVNILPSEPSVGFGIIYAFLEGSLLIAETILYKKLFDGFKSMYARENSRARPSLILYFTSNLLGIALNLGVWFSAENEKLWWISLCFIVWMIVNIAVSTFLAYGFYLLKPQFNTRSRKNITVRK